MHKLSLQTVQMRTLEPFWIQRLYFFEIPLESRCTPEFSNQYECWRRYRVEMLISLIGSYLNQLKEKQPLQHGGIPNTVPELMKDLVRGLEGILTVA